MIFNRSKKDLLAEALDRTGFGRLLRLARTWEGLLILNYHRIGEHRASLLDRNLWSASTEEFDLQVEYVTRNFDVIGLGDLDTALRRRRGRAVMITFDDGYLDNYTEAFPVLSRHRVPATFFITTGFLDIPKVPWWDEIAWMTRTSPLTRLVPNAWVAEEIVFDLPDRERAIHALLKTFKLLRASLREDEFLNCLGDALQTGRCPVDIAQHLWMSWDQIREMRRAGMTFGGHTVHHPILAHLGRDEQSFEIHECQRRLQAELSEPIEAFSYPVGGQDAFNETTRELLQEAGYRWAFTYFGGYCPLGQFDRFRVPRTAIETDINLSLFRATTTIPQLFA